MEVLRVPPPGFDGVTPRLREIAGAMADLANFADRFTVEFDRPAASFMELEGWALEGGLEIPVVGGDDGTSWRLEYIPSPGHRSFTVHAFEEGLLVLSLHTGGISNGPFDYPALLSSMKGEEILGTTPENLLWTPPFEENPLGNLVSDAVREAGSADIGLYNAYGLRGNIPAGPIPAGIIEHVIPFPNSIRVVEMTGEELIGTMERGVSERWFLYASGITVRHNYRLGIPFFEVLIDDRPVDPGERYRVAVSDWLITGSDPYNEISSAGPGESTGVTVREAVEDYLRSHPDWRPDHTERVITR